MAAQRGKDILLKIGDGESPEVFTTVAGLGEAIARAVGGLFGGARADGGSVLSGGAYLVGERGPEVFRPSTSGVIEPGGPSGPMTINLNLEGGGQSLLRSEAQIAQMLARAVSLGARRL